MQWSEVEGLPGSGILHQVYHSCRFPFRTVVLVPLTEELLYRGLIFRPLYNKSPLAGYVISTFIFSALHVVSYIGSYSPLHLALCFLQYLPASICLGWAYARSDSIWSPVMIHMTINFIGALSMR